MIAKRACGVHNKDRTAKFCPNGGIALKQSLQITALGLIAALLFLLPVCGAETSVVTLVGDGVRVQLLSDTVIRVEAKDASGFEDRATLIAAGRADFSGVAAATRTEGDNLIAETDRFVVTLAKGKALTADAVTVADKNGNTMPAYRIVGSQESDPMHGIISEESPFGKAFLGAKEGQDVVVEAPFGNIHYPVVKIEH